MGVVTVGAPWLPAPGPAPVETVRIAHANVNEMNPNLARGIADLVDERADVVVVIEASQPSERRLRAWFPYRALIGDQLVVSRYPVRFLPRAPTEDYPGERFEVRLPSGRIVVYAVHLDRPNLRHPEKLLLQGREVYRLLHSAREERQPTLLVGDFNLSDRTETYRRIADRFSDAMRADWAGPTYVRPLLRPLFLRIDHLFVPRGWCSDRARRFRVAGSDHTGIVADVGPCPARAGVPLTTGGIDGPTHRGPK